MQVLAALVAAMFAAVSGFLIAESERSADAAEIGHRLGEVAGWLIAAVAALGAGR